MPERGRQIAARAALVAILAAAAWVLPEAAARSARPALVNFGPNDTSYIKGFRQDWERDGRTRFRWTTRSALVTIPLRVKGEGAILRLRLSRHLVEPAHVRLIVGGRTVNAFDISSRADVAYRLVETHLPPLDGRQAFALVIEAPSDNPRPLGVALDWLELDRGTAGAHFALLDATRLAALLAVLLALAGPWLAGSSFSLAALHALGLLAVVTFGAWWDVTAAERILRTGLGAYAAAVALALILARAPAARRLLRLDSPRVAGAVATLALLAVAIRLLLVLHPQFYYPDVRVHATFAWLLERRGLRTFLADFTANQFRYSLGLQFENGHWYAFPYPPAFYLATWPLTRLLGYRPDVAVSVVPAVLNGLEAFVIFGIARRLSAPTGVALAAAAAQPVLPIFLARLSLAYFPALVGHFVDAALLLVLLAAWRRLERPLVVLLVAGLLATALLTYTQSLLSLGIMLPLWLVLDLVSDRSPDAGRRRLGLLAAGALGLAIAFGAFYGRYVPVFLQMRQGVPMPEEHVALELFEYRAAVAPPGELRPEASDDPFAQPGLNPLRGLAKAGWRLFLFYGAFAPLVVLGTGMAIRQASPEARPLVLAWAATFVALNLASGGLPGPNLFRYTKDVLLVAPLCCLALAVCAAWLWRRWRPLGAGLGLLFLAFGAWRSVGYLTATFVIERF